MDQSFTKARLKNRVQMTLNGRMNSLNQVAFDSYQADETVEQVYTFALDFQDPALSQIGWLRCSAGLWHGFAARVRVGRQTGLLEEHGALVVEKQTREQDSFEDLDDQEPKSLRNSIAVAGIQSLLLTSMPPYCRNTLALSKLMVSISNSSRIGWSFWSSGS